MRKDEINELIVAAFAAGILVGIALIMVVLLIVRNVTDAYGAEAPVRYIEITEGPESATEAVPEPESLGNFKVSFYCSCAKCNGRFPNGEPRSVDRYGNPLAWGTVAVDPSVVKMHTKLMIEGFDGVTFEALDTGGDNVTGKHIDIFWPGSHKEALRMNDRIERAIVWKVIE